MWYFATHTRENGEELLRWAFLFAAPRLFQSYENSEFSLLHLFIGGILLTLFSSGQELLNTWVKDISPPAWAVYGRLLTFLGHLIFNCRIASQIWLGLVISKIISDMFNYHNDLSIFWAFTGTLILISSVFRCTVENVESLR